MTRMPWHTLQSSLPSVMCAMYGPAGSGSGVSTVVVGAVGGPSVGGELAAAGGVSSWQLVSSVTIKRSRIVQSILFLNLEFTPITVKAFRIPTFEIHQRQSFRLTPGMSFFLGSSDRSVFWKRIPDSNDC